MDNYTIYNIEALTLDDVLQLNPEKITINQHDIYFVDFGGRFGFSALVFRNGSHLYYANDYQLHHTGTSLPDLKQWYIDTMKNKLFSDDMIYKPVNSHIEYEKKTSYLRDYYPLMCKDKISAFNIFKNDQERADFHEKTKNMYFSRIGYFYSNDEAFINKLDTLYSAAVASKDGATDNYNYWLEAFKYEMYNHEYSINRDADCDTLSVFCNVPDKLYYSFDHGKICLTELLKALKFNDTQIKAYKDARSYVLDNSNF